MVMYGTMRVHVSDPAVASDLGAFLRERIGAIVEQRGGSELEVSLLGSFNDGRFARSSARPSGSGAS